MHLANVNNKRSTPSPGLTGTCPACSSPVIAKCGTQRVHHWAHRGKRVCDRWWEPETEWHRNWKRNFPEDWQEVILRDERTGEKHIADVRTAQGLTIEFQHSHLRPKERETRENFYDDMVWVVHGLRLGGDLPRFNEGKSNLRLITKGVYVHRFPEELFPKTWLMCKAPVFFDFGIGSPPADPQAPVERFLWCLLPQRVDGLAIVSLVSRESFVRAARVQSTLLLGQSIQAKVEQWLAAERRLQEILRDRLALLQKHQRRPSLHRKHRRQRF